MYIGVDIGGTKTLVAVFDPKGKISERRKFPTPKNYVAFLKELSNSVVNLSTKVFLAAGVAVPGAVDRKQGMAITLGNLPWKNVPIQSDIQKILKCPVVIDNDANLGGLSEATLLPQYNTVLYITISTGIGTGIITNQRINPALEDSEGGHIILEHDDKLCTWESFASGHAIVQRFGKKASEINDSKTWQIIAHDIGLGLFDLIASIEPDAVVLGGAVLDYYDRFKGPLLKELQQYATPITPIPPIFVAQRPEEAVVFGCYTLAKSTHGTTH